jgi:antitoxin component YwqK of YwqJK toxin-antitoxin module
MYKLFFLPLIAVLFLAACGTPAEKVKPGSDSTAKSGLSIGDEHDDLHQPHTVDSIFNGPFIDRYDNGVIYMKGEVSGGLRVGEWITFYESGKEWSKGIYKAGLREGYGVSYHENGQKSSEGNYKNDRMVGKWKFWNEQGQLKEKDFGGE